MIRTSIIRDADVGSEALQRAQQVAESAPSRIAWFDSVGHAWAVESVPRAAPRADEASSAAAGRGAATFAASATTPFRSASAATAHAHAQADAASPAAPRFCGVCLGTRFTQEMCARPAGSLPLQALARMRSAGSSPVGVLCNVAVLVSAAATGAHTMRDVTAWLVPDELAAEAADEPAPFALDPTYAPAAAAAAAAAASARGAPLPPSAVLESNAAACAALHLPSAAFQFIRCAAEAYGGAHTAGGGASTPYVRDSSQVRLALNQRQPDAALLERVVSALAASDSLRAACARSSVVFSLYDAQTGAAAQAWFVSDAQVAHFGTAELLVPGVWRDAAAPAPSPAPLAAATPVTRALALDTVVFVHASLLATHGDQFGRVLEVADAYSANGGGGGGGGGESASALHGRRAQLLQQRQHAERALAEAQRRVAHSGSAAERLQAERQLQRLVMGELALLERRVGEVRALAEQERRIADDTAAKHALAARRLEELEGRRRALQAEHRALAEEGASNDAVAEALRAQLQMLEQRLAAASAAIVGFRAAATAAAAAAASAAGGGGGGGGADGHAFAATGTLNPYSRTPSAALPTTAATAAQRADEARGRHEIAVGDAQRHFSHVQQSVADAARDAEEQHAAELRALQADLAALQQHKDAASARLGEMRASAAASEALRAALDREYADVRETLNALMQASPELAAAQPGGVLDERRDKLAACVRDAKAQVAELAAKADAARDRRDGAQDRVLESERLLQRCLATLQLRVPPQLEQQREMLCDEERQVRDAVAQHFAASLADAASRMQLAAFALAHRGNHRRHARRHDELRLERGVAEEHAAQALDRLGQVRASCDVFGARMDECAREQARLRDDHNAAVALLQRQLVLAETEPVEEAVRADAAALARRIAQTHAEVELLQGALMKLPGGGAGFNGGAGSSASAVVAAAMAGSASTFAAHRSLRAAAPHASEVRARLRALRRDSHRRNRSANARADELDARLGLRRGELREKAALLAALRGAVTELHEQLQARTAQLAERERDAEQLRGRDAVLVADLEEELAYARTVAARHRAENRLQAARVASMVQEQEAELARSRHEVARLERGRNEARRRMSESNEATLLMELDHEHQRRDELRAQLREAGVAASPPERGASGRGWSADPVGDDDDLYNNSYDGGGGGNNSYSHNAFAYDRRMMAASDDDPNPRAPSGGYGDDFDGAASRRQPAPGDLQDQSLWRSPPFSEHHQSLPSVYSDANVVRTPLPTAAR